MDTLYTIVTQRADREWPEDIRYSGFEERYGDSLKRHGVEYH